METTLPRCGFSLAVSGSTMPPAVRSSASTGLTTTRSSSGRSLVLAMTIPHNGFGVHDERLKFFSNTNRLRTWLQCFGGMAVNHRVFVLGLLLNCYPHLPGFVFDSTVANASGWLCYI